MATGLTEEQAKAKVAENTQGFEGLGSDVKKSKPEEKFLDLIKYIEGQYDCSGMCSPSLFYLVNPVTAGPPKDACLAPFVGDIMSLLGDLGSALIASGVFFLLMIFFVLPMCCLTKIPSDSIHNYNSKEGGSIEIAKTSNSRYNDLVQTTQDQITNV